MDNKTVLSKITESNELVRKGKQQSLEILPFSSGDKRNEAVIFLKPEVSSDDAVKLPSILGLIEILFEEFHVQITGAKVLGASYLEEHQIIQDHYRKIFEISSKGPDGLTDAALDTLMNDKDFNELSSLITNGAPCVGGHQLLQSRPEITLDELSELWEAKKGGSKLESGSYVAQIDEFGDSFVLLNGFCPGQIKYFTKDLNSIIVFAISSDTSWEDLRLKMIGDTNPAEAMKGSLRNQMLTEKRALGLTTVNKGANGVHMSAGPIEGLAELVRFFSDYDSKEILALKETTMGKILESSGFDAKQVFALMNNETEISNQPVHDLTELKDTEEIVPLLIAGK